MAADHEAKSAHVGEVDARQLLARAAEIDAVQGTALTITQLRAAALEAGIGRDAFDAALAERASLRARVSPTELSLEFTPLSPVRSADQRILRGLAKWWMNGGRESVRRNALAVLLGWAAATVAHGVVQSVSSSWLAEKAADPFAMAVAAGVALRLGARRLAIAAGGLAISQGAEFVLDVLNGAPAVHGFDPHLALMAAGVALAALIDWRLRRPPASDRNTHNPTSLAERLRDTVADWFGNVRRFARGATVLRAIRG